MSKPDINGDSEHLRMQIAVEASLLHAAFDRLCLSLGLTVIAAVVFGGLLSSFFPASLMMAWIALILAVATARYLMWRAYQRAAPPADALLKWRRLFFIGAVVAGVTWTIGPMLMIPDATGAGLAFLIGTLLCVCAVGASSLAPQQAAMHAYFAFALVPPTISVWYGGQSDIERYVALLLVAGLIAVSISGRRASQAMRATLEAQYKFSTAVSEANASRTALQESENRYRALVEWSPEAVAVQRGGKFLYVNPAAVKMFGASSAEELIGKPMLDLTHPDYRAQVLERMQHFSDRTVAAPRVEEKLVKLDGTVIDVEVQSASIIYGGAMAVHISASDITERKRADEKLRDSEARYRTLVEWSPEPTAVHRAGKILYVNPAAVKLLAASSAADLIGQPMLSLLHPDFHALALSRVNELLARGLGSPFANATPMTFLRFDGTTAEIEIQSTVIVYDDELAIQTIAHDVTEKKYAEATRASLEAQLRESQKMEAIGTLAGGIAHDFNNILATILGNAELARQDVSDNPQAVESLNEIKKAGTRARDLVQQILSFSRRQPTALKRTSLAPIIEESVQLLRATIPARVSIQIHADANVPAVLADVTQIEQTLINLCTNAMQAMRGGPGCINILLGTVMLDANMVDAFPPLRGLYLAHPGRTARLTVSDNGCGMDAATVKRIFEPFFTTKAVNEGTGLGLSVVHGIVRGHEGAIVVESEPGRGSTFTIYLPLAPAATAALVPVERIPAMRATTPPLVAGQHILYLDDDESLVLLVIRLLERRGYRVSGFTAQREALSALRADPAGFDLVVTDYNMPGMSGLDVAREVRAIRADMPVAIASGFVDESLRAQADGAGVRDLIFKANSVEEFCEAFEMLARKTQVASGEAARE
ncbi:MAG: PAS domain S-box protein [Usitatibacteraceae bacterium]